MSDALPPIGELVLADRYLTPGETVRRHVFKRVARALASCEPPEQRERSARSFYANMLHGAIGAGRIMANAGTAHDATMINCFVHPIGSAATGDGVADAAGIDRALDAARATLAMGGGIGYDFSPVPPAQAALSAGSGDARDVCACIDRFDAACAALSFVGSRRGAQMAVLRCDHPDLPAFVKAKRGRRRWSTFNVSVGVSDAFMRAVERDAPWTLSHRAMPSRAALASGAARLADGRWRYATVPARAMWEDIVEYARDSAEPGLLFIDTINAANDLASIETIAATNPCGEQPLPPWGSCVLGPIDLSRLVHCPFGVGGEPAFDFARLGHCVRVQVRMLDNVLEITRWPLPEHRQEALSKRRIGVGVTGLADALAMMRLRYDGEPGRALAASIARCMRDEAYAASSALAAERGPYPLFNATQSLSTGHFGSRLPAHVREAIALHGLRNSHLLSFAPTGSVSLAFAGNCSSGVEPVFDWTYRRAVRIGRDAPRVFQVENRAYRSYRRFFGEGAPLPAYFLKTNDVSPSAHVDMLRALQPFVDAGISKTVIVSPNVTADDVAALFFEAWRGGLKGITVFRPDEALDAILSPGTPESSERSLRCSGC